MKQYEKVMESFGWECFCHDGQSKQWDFSCKNEPDAAYPGSNFGFIHIDYAKDKFGTWHHVMYNPDGANPEIATGKGIRALRAYMKASSE